MFAYRLGAPYRLERIEVERPTADDLAPGQVLLRMLAGGICGSDVPRFAGKPWVRRQQSAALFPGLAGYPLHEVVGEVLASRDEGIAVGQRVVGWSPQTNGLAEYAIVNGAGVYAYDGSLSPADAVLLQPLACVVSALRRVPDAARSYAILGTGAIGVLFGHVLKSRGGADVVGVDPVDRGDVLPGLGFDRFHNMNSANWASLVRAGDLDSPDVVIEVVGHQTATLNDATVGVASGGFIFYFGQPDEQIATLDVSNMFYKNITLASGHTLDKKAALADADRYLLAHPKLASTVITHSFPADQAQEAYLMAASARPDRLKVTITFGE